MCLNILHLETKTSAQSHTPGQIDQILWGWGLGNIFFKRIYDSVCHRVELRITDETKFAPFPPPAQEQVEAQNHDFILEK